MDITDISKFNYCIIKEVYNTVYLNYQNRKITKDKFDEFTIYYKGKLQELGLKDEDNSEL